MRLLKRGCLKGGRVLLKMVVEYLEHYIYPPTTPKLKQIYRTFLQTKQHAVNTLNLSQTDTNLIINTVVHRLKLRVRKYIFENLFFSRKYPFKA